MAVALVRPDVLLVELLAIGQDPNRGPRKFQPSLATGTVGDGPWQEPGDSRSKGDPRPSPVLALLYPIVIRRCLLGAAPTL